MKALPTLLIVCVALFALCHCIKLDSVCTTPITKSKILGIHTCECLFDASPQWGEQILIVNCAELELEQSEYPATLLPAETVILDLSYNFFVAIPIANGEHLRLLDLSYNQIDALKDYDFVKLRDLINLNLARNKIATIGENAFFGLQNLLELDLSGNSIQQLPTNVFMPMANLNQLILSGNQNLGTVLAEVGVDFYQYLGTNPNLEKLEIERCNLTTINVSRGSGLKTLYAAKNFLTDLSELPFALETLDISENSVEMISAGFFPKLSYLKMLLVQDMPALTRVEADSLTPLSQLMHLSFRGSLKLNHFDSNAFGDPGTMEIPLEILNLQGTNITTFNQSMQGIASRLKAFDLEGIPLECDCNVGWIRNLDIETNALCMEPSSLKGVMASGVPDRKYECHLFPKWVYTTLNSILIILILIGCTASVWFLFTRLKRKTDRHNVKVGAQSPYAPVTTVQSPK